jgi:hypothetical protein
LKELQGVLGLVDDENGIVGVVEAADGFVRVVCAKAPPESRQRTAHAMRIPSEILGRRSQTCCFVLAAAPQLTNDRMLSAEFVFRSGVKCVRPLHAVHLLGDARRAAFAPPEQV